MATSTVFRPKRPCRCCGCAARARCQAAPGNVAANIASLGGRATLIGLIGLDEAGTRLRQLLSQQERIADVLVPSAHRPTICKTRFIAGRQQVVRTDDESEAALLADEEAGVIAAFAAHLPGCHALILFRLWQVRTQPRVL